MKVKAGTQMLHPGETQSAIKAMKDIQVVCVEMEAAALYAYAEIVRRI